MSNKTIFVLRDSATGTVIASQAAEPEDDLGMPYFVNGAECYWCEEHAPRPATTCRTCGSDVVGGFCQYDFSRVA